MTALTLFHVAISLVGIGSGFVVIFGFLKDRRPHGWTALFLTTTVLTSVTGFLFPFHKFLPSYAIGALSLLILAIAILGRYRFHLNGAWRPIYVVSAVAAQYFNVFVLVAQLFAKVPALKAVAPTQSEPPFAITQLIVLALFVWLGVLAVKRFRGQPAQAAFSSSSSR